MRYHDTEQSALPPLGMQLPQLQGYDIGSDVRRGAVYFAVWQRTVDLFVLAHNCRSNRDNKTE